MRWRMDGFTPAKQRTFLKWLGKTGCKKDAAGKAGISTTTVDRWRNRSPEFEARCQAALAMASTELEAIAYQRATEGAEEKVIRDGKVAFIRKKPSDAMLKTLMAGANPRKYGSGQLGAADLRRLRRKIEAELRPKIEQEIEARHALETRGGRMLLNGPNGRKETLREALERRLAEIGSRLGDGA